MTQGKLNRIRSAVQKGIDADSNANNCAQSTIAALMGEFFPDHPCTEQLIKAGSMLYGLGGRGQTCGSIQGCMQFLGILYGRDNTKQPLLSSPDVEQYYRKISIIGDFADAFEQKFGSTQCGEIHPTVVGSRYALRTYEDQLKFAEAGGHKCRRVIAGAIRLACEMILDDDGNLISRDSDIKQAL